jgi:hypothetical protein
MPEEAILVSAAFAVLEAGLWPDAGQQPFVRAVVVARVEEEPVPGGGVPDLVGVPVQYGAAFVVADLAGHVRDEGFQDAEAGVAQDAVVDRPEDVEDRAVDPVGRVGVRRGARG